MNENDIEHIINQMKYIPIRNFYHADRYDTDNEYVIHLWTEIGQKNFDIRIKKEKIKCPYCDDFYYEGGWANHLLMKHHQHAG